MRLDAVLSGFPIQLFSDAGRRDPPLHAGATERHLGQDRASIRPSVPRKHRTHPGVVLCTRCGNRLPRARQHRHGRDAGADGDGCRQPRADPRVPHGDHGGQWCAVGRALTIRTDRDHRQRPDGEDWSRRVRVAHVLDQPGRPCGTGLCRLSPAGRMEAVSKRVRQHRGRGAGLSRLRCQELDDDRRAVLHDVCRPLPASEHRHGGVRGRGLYSPLFVSPTTTRRYAGCRGPQSSW